MKYFFSGTRWIFVSFRNAHKGIGQSSCAERVSPLFMKELFFQLWVFYTSRVPKTRPQRTHCVSLAHNSLSLLEMHFRNWNVLQDGALRSISGSHARRVRNRGGSGNEKHFRFLSSVSTFHNKSPRHKIFTSKYFAFLCRVLVTPPVRNGLYSGFKMYTDCCILI